MKNEKNGKPVVAVKNSNNKVWKPVEIKLALCTRTGRIVHLNDVHNPNR